MRISTLFPRWVPGALCLGGLWLSGSPVTAQLMASAQQSNRQRSSVAEAPSSLLRDALLSLIKERTIQILFDERLLSNRRVMTGNLQSGASVERILAEWLAESGLTYKRLSRGSYVIINAQTRHTQLQTSAAAPAVSGNESRPALPVTDQLQSADTPTATSQQPWADRAITGRVTNETGEGLPGANVVMKGTGPTFRQRGTTTDSEGHYRLSIPDGGDVMLVFSSVGYMPQEVAVGNRTTIDLRMSPDDKTLNEVVVVGYGTVRKSDLTGSLVQVKAKELNAFPATTVLQALSGRAAGVQVLQSTGGPGAPASVRIRGTNSIQGSNEPLYVVDGFPLSGNNPTVLNNADIENIEILKDASATAIYGSRGANGVKSEKHPSISRPAIAHKLYERSWT